MKSIEERWLSGNSVLSRYLHVACLWLYLADIVRPPVDRRGKENVLRALRVDKFTKCNIKKLTFYFLEFKKCALLKEKYM
jgi:hypothetical protein